MKLVYIAHPLRGAEREKNVAEVTRICRKISELFPEVLPISPIHAFSFLDGCGAEGERTALGLCLEAVKHCDEVWFFGDWRHSEGCKSEYFVEAKKSGLDNAYYFDEMACDELWTDPNMTIAHDPRLATLARWLLSEVYEGVEA